MIVKARNAYIVLIGLLYLIFAVYRLSLNALTPDEIKFTGDFFITYQGDVNYQYIIANYIFSTFFMINKYFNVLVNIFLMLICSFFFYRTLQRKGYLNNNFFIFLTLCIPSVLFFSSAYLRDFQVFLISMLLVYFAGEGRIKQFYLLTILSVFFRTEAAVFFLVAFVFSKYKFNYFKLLPFVFFLLYLLFMYTPLDKLLMIKTLALQDFSVGFGLFQLPFNKLNAFISSLLNWPLYFTPFLFFQIKEMSHVFFLLDSYITLFLIVIAVFGYNGKIFEKDRVYRFCVYMLALSFIVAMPESDPLTMVRHKIMYMPFLFYVTIVGFKYKLLFKTKSHKF